LDNILTEVLSDGDAQLQGNKSMPAFYVILNGITEVLIARHECRRFVELSSDHTNPVGQTLEEWLDTAYARMAKCSSEDSLEWRMLYTDISFAMAIASCRADPVTTILAEDAVCHLDKAIILAGAPGEGRHELILELISAIQAQYLPTNGLAGYGNLLSSHSRLDVLACTTAQAHITRLDHTPSFISFVSELSRHPFVLSGFAKDYPALTDRPWSSAAYLRSVAGPGRQIPVEVGIDYRTDDWTQKLMSWDAFLSHLSTPETNGEVLYLAQHDLFKQFPVLANDISVPDYAYASLPANSDYPNYQPPRNDEQLVMNVWLGPRGAISPAHTDPFHNFYSTCEYFFPRYLSINPPQRK
jgi:hypothetical protein